LKKTYKIAIILIVIFFLSTTGLSKELKSTNLSDIDPLVDLTITVDILKIRSLEHDDPQLHFREIIDKKTDPDFYTKIIVNGQEYTSDIYWNTRYIYENLPSITVDVPDNIESVDIKIQLWDAKDEWALYDRLCDISPDDGTSTDAFDAEISYNLKTGHWTRDDYVGDISGYGRLNGCEDGTIYEADRDCELWFDITFNDFDSDRIPYFIETNQLYTDPLVDDSETDFDEDIVPTWWEFRYNYDPKSYDEHDKIDNELDGISNLNEYRTYEWFSDPYTKDLFVEMDQMEEGPNGELCIFPEISKEMLYTAYDRQNVVFHIDDGQWLEESGSEFIPFDDLSTYSELIGIQNQYFYDNSPQPWRKDVFHYGVVVFRNDRAPGMAFRRNAYQISAGDLDDLAIEHGYDRDVVYASAYMHEMGHNLNFRPIPGHGKLGWLIRIIIPVYKSCMSYGMIYRMCDYSDGSRPFINSFIGDYNDWERMDLTHFRN